MSGDYNEPREEPLEKRVERLEGELEQVRAELRGVSQKLDGVDAVHEKPENVRSHTKMRESGNAGSGSFSTSRATTTPTAEANNEDSRGPESKRELFSDPHSGGQRRASGSRLDLGNLGDLRSGEWWLGKLGIGLVLFGVAFLFAYSVQRGWLTPPVQVAIGLATGIALLAVGLRVYQERRTFSQVLLGGGVGSLYITGFASYQVYVLVPYALAFGFMVAVTLLACALSMRQDEVSLSVIGALGGLGTPFLVYNDAGGLWGLVLYTGLILSGMAAVYLYKRWVSLLVVCSVGGWAVLVAGYTGTDISPAAASDGGDRLALQLGVAFVWLLFWLVPVVKEVLGGPTSGSGRGAAHNLTPASVSAHAHTVVSPLIALGFTAAIWAPTLRDLGWVALCGALLYALAAIVLQRVADSIALRRSHALVSLLLFTLAIALILRGEVLYLALAAEAAALILIGRRYSDEIVSLGAHVLFSIIAVWFAFRLLPIILGDSAARDLGLSGVAGLADLAVIALAAGISVILSRSDLKIIYRLAAHVALLLLLWRELATLPGGDGWVTVSWGIYAAGLLVGGLRLDRTALVRLGLWTLFAVVVKLFVVDLATIDAIWRVLLFMGFGGAFLALSYYLRSLWQPSAGSRR